MFRPTPETTFFRRIPYRLIVSVLLILALVVSVILLFNLEQQKLLLQGFAQGKTVPTELFQALWQSRSDLIVVTFLVFLVSAIGIAAVITFPITTGPEAPLRRSRDWHGTSFRAFRLACSR